MKYFSIIWLIADVCLKCDETFHTQNVIKIDILESTFFKVIEIAIPTTAKREQKKRKTKKKKTF